MKKKTKVQKLGAILENFNLQERKEFRQTGIALMSWSAEIAIFSGLFYERIAAFTIDEIEGSFAYNASCQALVEKFQKLKEENMPEKERQDQQHKVNAYILLLLSGVFAEMFYLTGNNDIALPPDTTLEDVFNYVFFQPDYDAVRAKINALLELTGEPPIEPAPNKHPVNGGEPAWVRALYLYKAEMGPSWARKTQLEAIEALRKLKKMTGAQLWHMASENMKKEKAHPAVLENI